MKTLSEERKMLDRAAENIERLLKPQDHGLTIVGTYSAERLTVDMYLAAGIDKIGWLGEITLEQAEKGLCPGQAQAIRDRYDNLVAFYEKSNKLDFDVHIVGAKSNKDDSPDAWSFWAKKKYEDMKKNLENQSLYKTHVMADWGDQIHALNHLKNQTFGMAIYQLKQGRRAYREGWNGKNMYIRLEREKPERNQLAYIELSTADGKYVPWLASQTDILAEDWCII